MKLIICDFNKTLYDPMTQQLFPGALETLGYFHKQASTLVLLSTEAPNRAQSFTKLGITPYFDKVYFVVQKTAKSILDILGHYHAVSQSVLIIGDDPDGELLIAQQLQIPAIAVGTGFCDQQTAKTLGVAFCTSIKEVPEVKL